MLAAIINAVLAALSPILAHTAMVFKFIAGKFIAFLETTFVPNTAYAANTAAKTAFAAGSPPATTAMVNVGSKTFMNPHALPAKLAALPARLTVPPVAAAPAGIVVVSRLSWAMALYQLFLAKQID